MKVLSMLEQRAYGWFHYYGSRFNMSASFRSGLEPYLDFNAVGTGTGLAKMPYLRDTRRSVGLDGFKLYYTNITNANANGSNTASDANTNRTNRNSGGDGSDGGKNSQRQHSTRSNASAYGVHFKDTVAIGSYAHDTHGLKTCPIPPYVADAPPSKPYYMPFRALTNDGAANLLVAGKTMATTFSANSATRLHPEEWSSGVAAGVAAGLLASTAPEHTSLTKTEDLVSGKGFAALQQLLLSESVQQPLDWY